MKEQLGHTMEALCIVMEAVFKNKFVDKLGLDKESLRTVLMVWEILPRLFGFFCWKKYFYLYRIKSSLLSHSWGKYVCAYIIHNSGVAHVQRFLKTDRGVSATEMLGAFVALQ